MAIIDHSVRHFMTNMSTSSQPLQELGHQTVNPVWSQLTGAISKGFLSGLVVASIGQDNTTGRSQLYGLGMGVGMAVDSYISDYSRELSYDHEYAREVWEHEYNSIGEVDEYVAYATSRGLSPTKAREIALTVTAEPIVSVPYHLAFELGLIEPVSYRRKLTHSAIVGAGYFAGWAMSHGGLRLASAISSASSSAKSAAIATAVCALAMTPVLAVRYHHVRRVPNGKRLQLASLVAYAGAISLIILIGRSRT